jgi:hypothetical protein
MAVMVIVAVIVAKHPSVVCRTTSQVDVIKTLGNQFVARKPDLLLQKRTLPLSFEPVNLTRRRLNGRSLLRHISIES